MNKKIFFSFLLCIFVLSPSLINGQAQASSDYNGKIVHQDGQKSLYYVGSDNKRYVFPTEGTYKSWFADFDDVQTISAKELSDLDIGGNVVYRPGILLIKIQTNPKVYAVSKSGTLRWLKNEKVANALYGENWNMLIDDVPDPFFVNYKIGDDIDDESDFNPKEEVENVDNIDTNNNLSSTNSLHANTKMCQIINNSRDCKSDNKNEDDEDSSNDNNAPYITNISVDNEGERGYIDMNDAIIITFNEAIDPLSIKSDLIAGGYYSFLNYSFTGALNLSSTGLMTIENIASFDIGSVADECQFSVKIKLSPDAKTLTISITDGNNIEIEDEDFENAKQIGGTIKDKAGNLMENKSDINEVDGSFGGENIDDGIEPYILSIEAKNYGQDDYIDVDDEIHITFSEEIESESINESLEEGSSVSNVEASETGGVYINDNGILTVSDITSFYIGDIVEEGTFEVSLELDSDGEVLIITLTEGDNIEVEDEDLNDAEQIGGTIEDKHENEMDDDPNINDPTGTFVEDSTGGDIYILEIKTYDTGYAGYIDVDDKIVITFNDEINPQSINSRLDKGDSIEKVEHDETGGVYIDEDGMLTITDILLFDMGEIDNEGKFEVKLSLNSDSDELTITLTQGDAIKINKEDFSDAEQIGGYIENENDKTLEGGYVLDDPNGTFGGDSTDSTPYITEIEIENGNQSNHIDEGDVIIVVFNKPIDPESINEDLDNGDSVEDVDDDDTGGINVDDNGYLRISDIAEFYVGEVDDDGDFEVTLELNSTGNILTITLTDGDSIEIDDQDIGDAEQLGGTIEDEDNNEMEDDPRINDPERNF